MGRWFLIKKPCQYIKRGFHATGIERNIFFGINNHHGTAGSSPLSIITIHFPGIVLYIEKRTLCFSMDKFAEQLRDQYHSQIR